MVTSVAPKSSSKSPLESLTPSPSRSPSPPRLPSSLKCDAETTKESPIDSGVDSFIENESSIDVGAFTDLVGTTNEEVEVQESLRDDVTQTPSRMPNLEGFNPVSSKMRSDICASSYMEAELELILYEERCIARETAIVERSLREVEGEEREDCDHLIQAWLQLVHRKSKVFHRRMLLDILCSEEDLGKKQEILSQELRRAHGVDEGREEMLLAQLVSIVEARDQLERKLEEEEKMLQHEEQYRPEIDDRRNRPSKCNMQ